MDKLFRIYNSTGRIGNIILLALLILSGIANRMFMSIKYREIDYIIESVLIVLSLILVRKLFKRSTQVFEKRKLKLFRIILYTGIALRILFAGHDMINRPVQDSDYEKHEKLGIRILEEGEFYDFAGVELRNFRQPGLPMMFAAGLKIYNAPITFSIIMILFSFGVLVGGYYLFRNLNNIASILAFAYLSISPNMLFMASNSNTQLSFFFFLIILFIILKNFNGKTYQLLIIGALLAAEMYVRFNFIMIFLLIPFFIEFYKDKKLSFALGKYAIVFAGFLLLYSPWIIRNYMTYGTIRLMPTTGLGLYSTNMTKDPKKVGDYNGVPDSVLKKYSKLSEVEFDEALKKETFDFVKENPDVIIKSMPFKMMKYSGRQDWTISYFFQFTEYEGDPFMEGLFQSIENFLIWMILFYSIFYLWKNKNLGSLSVYILWSYLVYTMILMPVTETRSRYNFPYILFPVIAISLSNGNNIRKEIPD
ncbi:MAG TPA: hypothetical protein PK294_00875 [Ignavibacteria bacterium]|nr:hypothetical protein [Ignavibacteria bacterium]